MLNTPCPNWCCSHQTSTVGVAGLQHVREGSGLGSCQQVLGNVLQQRWSCPDKGFALFGLHTVCGTLQCGISSNVGWHAKCWLASEPSPCSARLSCTEACSHPALGTVMTCWQLDKTHMAATKKNHKKPQKQTCWQLDKTHMAAVTDKQHPCILFHAVSRHNNQANMCFHAGQHCQGSTANG